MSFKVNDGGRSYAEAEAEAEAAVADARRTFGRRRRDKHTHMISQKKKIRGRGEKLAGIFACVFLNRRKEQD